MTQRLQEAHQEAHQEAQEAQGAKESKEDVTKEDEDNSAWRRIQRTPTAMMMNQALKDLEDALDFNTSEKKKPEEEEED